MFKTDGILFVALLRLMFIPYGLTSYVLGVTCVSVLDYMIGTSVYIVKIMLCVFIGCSIYQASEEAQDDKGNKNYLIILIIEIVLTVIITIAITIWAYMQF